MSTVVAAILMVLICVSLGAIFAVWSSFFWHSQLYELQRTFGEERPDFDIVDVNFDANTVRIYNSGTKDLNLELFRIYVNSEDRTLRNSGVILPGETAELNADLTPCPPCQITVACCGVSVSRTV